MQRSKLVCEWYYFSIKDIRKGYVPLLSKIVYNRVRGWTSGRDIPHKTSLSSPRGGGGLHYTWFTLSTCFIDHLTSVEKNIIKHMISIAGYII